jgi:SAM-dependent methyltransferase
VPWDSRYKENDLPWDTGRLDRHLEVVFDEHNIGSCRVLEVGCGTGTNAVWLASKGCTVVGVDVSETAIERAKQRATTDNAQATFLVADIFEDEIPGGPFDFIFDRGCFHSFDGPADRKEYAELMHGLLNDGGLWLSLIGSTDGPAREMGPPRRSAADIMNAVEECFEIVSLESTKFDSDAVGRPRAWACVMRRRSVSLEDEG